jgi:hypothetical protein
MGNVQILSTLQNKAMQKKAVHMSSSTVFLAVCSGDGHVDTEVSLLNHFILKRGIDDVVATVEFRDLKGEQVHTYKLNMDEPRAYSVRVSEQIKGAFIGSIYVYFNSNENLAVPFCAVMCVVKTQNSICGVHTYGRRLEQKELGGSLDLKSTVETGWTARDTSDVKSFAVLHGGHEKLTLETRLEISNSKNERLIVNKDYILEPYGTVIIEPQNLSDKVVPHLGGKKGHIKVYIDGLSGVFPRMLCGNFMVNSQTQFNLNEASEMQFTHTNFDFSTIAQPDAGSSLGYYNQPSIPAGYGIIYPVETSKKITIGSETYASNYMHHIEIDSMSQLEVTAEGENLPSRFVAATIAKWDGATLESECSTGTFIEDYLRVPCHWHWGLLKPGLEMGDSVISIILSKFKRNQDVSRSLKLRIFSEKMLLIEREVYVDGHQEINAMDLLPRKLPDGALWYVLSGDKLEDLNIFSTFYPSNKAGFVEHAF